MLSANAASSLHHDFRQHLQVPLSLYFFKIFLISYLVTRCTPMRCNRRDLCNTPCNSTLELAFSPGARTDLATSSWPLFWQGCLLVLVAPCWASLDKLPLHLRVLFSLMQYSIQSTQVPAKRSPHNYFKSFSFMAKKKKRVQFGLPPNFECQRENILQPMKQQWFLWLSLLNDRWK